MPTRNTFAEGEWYHCYNRGVDKRKVFQTNRDYNRFLSLLFLSNATERLHLSDYKDKDVATIIGMNLERGTPLVEIGAWCLMPNHIHLLMRETIENGITLFMQKVFTGYSMYFNKKNERTGPLFSGVFKAIHVDEDIYLKHLVSYIHMNPIEIQFPDWKEGVVATRAVSEFLDRYTYSSLHSFENPRDTLRPLLGPSIFEIFVDGLTKQRRGQMLKDAQEYFSEHNVKVRP